MLRDLQRAVAKAAIDYIHNAPIERGKVRLARTLAPLVDGVDIVSKAGPSLACVLRDATFWLNATGAHASLRFLEALQTGDAFIDIGANQGLFSLVASKAVGPTGKVISVEPSPREYPILLRNLELNGCDNVLPLNVALGEQAGSIDFWLSPLSHSGGNSAVLRHPGNVKVLATQIPGDLLLPKLAGNRRTMVKIDVEGYETQVLRGLGELLRNSQTHTVLCEVDEAYLKAGSSSRQELYALMDSYGFNPTSGLSSEHYDEVFVKSSRA